MHRRTRIGAAAVATLLASPSCRPQVRDDSTPTTAQVASALELPGREARSIDGEVARIAPADGAAGQLGWFDVFVRASAGETSFRLLGGEHGAFPLAVGVTVAARIDCTSGGWHHVCDGVLLDGHRTLIIASCGSGNIGIVPGWTLAFGPEISNMRGRRVRSLVLGHAGRTAVTRESEWRSLRTTDGTYLVRGARIDWVGARPPEATDYTDFTIVRIGPA